MTYNNMAYLILKQRNEKHGNYNNMIIHLQ